MRGMGDWTREELLEYLANMKKINELEARNPHYLPPEQAIQAIAGIYRLVPQETRDHDDDPRKEGARKMMAALAKLSG